MKIAILGAGVSGLTAAHKLSSSHEVTVFEAESRIGGHSHTVNVPTDAGEQPVDTGFIVFNNRNYPNFEALLTELGVAYEKSNMSFSVSDERHDFEYAGASPNALFATRSNLVNRKFLRMIKDLVRFNREALALAKTPVGDSDEISLRDYLVRGHYSEFFVQRLIVPQVSAVWSADPEQLWNFPARIVFQFFNNHGILELTGRPQWRTITGGSIEYVKQLAAPFADRIHTGNAAVAVSRGVDGVTVKLANGAEQIYDEVVFACHSDQALKMLTDPSEREQALLGAIPYVSNDVVLHTDSTLLPRRRAARASWNFHLLDEPRDRSTVTYWMNKLQNIDGPTDYCVTLNLNDQIDESKIISTHQYSHPVFTPEGLNAQEHHSEISGVNHTHYCGAYWRWGFHEDGVWSAVRVVDEIERTATRVVEEAGPDVELTATV